MILKLFMLSLCIGVALGFMCHACSYGGTDKDKGKAFLQCLNNLESLPMSSHIKCGNFCVTQEVFDKDKKAVISFVRTCSVNWGNLCTEDAWWVTCKTSCVGNFCNSGLIIDPDSEVAPKVCDPYFGCGGHNPFNKSSRNTQDYFAILTGLLFGLAYHWK